MGVTKEQALRCNEFHSEPCAVTIGPKGGVKVEQRIWRRNGQTKTWKTRPNEFSVPVKYGNKTYDYVNNSTEKHVHTAEDCPMERLLSAIHRYSSFLHAVLEEVGPGTYTGTEPKIVELLETLETREKALQNR